MFCPVVDSVEPADTATLSRTTAHTYSRFIARVLTPQATENVKRTCEGSRFYSRWEVLRVAATDRLSPCDHYPLDASGASSWWPSSLQGCPTIQAGGAF